MADDSEPEDDAIARELPGVEGAAALNLALGVASRETADAFLNEQSAMLRIQREHLHEQRALQISHLKWRRFNDWMRSGWQAMLVVVGAVALVAILTALWDASRANGLVVDAFTVPPDFDQRGLGGDVIASDLTNRLVAIRQMAVAHSYSNTNDVSQNRANAIKVEIPDTGISLGEVWRYMRRWLGHERHLSGSLREIAEGRIALTASVDGGVEIAATGKAADLAEIEQHFAEDIFGEFDPVNHINYLSATHRHRAAYEAASRFVLVAQTVLERSDSYGLWSYTTAATTGDIKLGLARARVGIGIDPNLAVLHVQAIRFYGWLGQDEAVLREARVIIGLKDADQASAHQGGGFAEMQTEARAKIAWLTGDFGNAVGWECYHVCAVGESLFSHAKLAGRMHDAAQDRALIAEAVAAGSVDQRGEDEARYFADAASGQWSRAADDASAARNLLIIPDGDENRRLPDEEAATAYAPLLAEAEAHSGKFAAAEAVIGRTPDDCIACETGRGEIDALENNPNSAAYWFRRADSDAPSIPFALTDWGTMLLYEGNYDAAIEKFKQANLKGPHFSDPLEMWGEALVQENRSDLALAKFEEANKYAPNWGRLHLEWGRALLYAGRRDEAKRQFDAAAHLDLSTLDAAMLARMRMSHV